MLSIAEWTDRDSALSSPMKLTSSANFSPNIRISLRLKIHQAQAKNFCRVLDIRVTQYVKISGRNAQFLQEFLKTVLQRSRFHRLVTVGKQVIIFARPEGTQYGKHFRRQRNRLQGVVGLWRLSNQLRAPAVVDSIGCASNMQQAAGKIDIRPAQGADLAQPNAGFQTQ